MGNYKTLVIFLMIFLSTRAEDIINREKKKELQDIRNLLKAVAQTIDKEFMPNADHLLGSTKHLDKKITDIDQLIKNTNSWDELELVKKPVQQTATFHTPSATSRYSFKYYEQWTNKSNKSNKISTQERGIYTNIPSTFDPPVCMSMGLPNDQTGRNLDINKNIHNEQTNMSVADLRRRLQHFVVKHKSAQRDLAQHKQNINSEYTKSNIVYIIMSLFGSGKSSDHDDIAKTCEVEQRECTDISPRSLYETEKDKLWDMSLFVDKQEEQLNQIQYYLTSTDKTLEELNRDPTELIVGIILEEFLCYLEWVDFYFQFIPYLNINLHGIAERLIKGDYLIVIVKLIITAFKLVCTISGFIIDIICLVIKIVTYDRRSSIHKMPPVFQEQFKVLPNEAAISSVMKDPDNLLGERITNRPTSNGIKIDKAPFDERGNKKALYC